MYALMCTVFRGTAHVFRDLSIPAELQQAPGFLGGSVLVNEASSKAALITWWESTEALDAAAQMIRQKGGFITTQEALRGTVAWTDRYSVVAHDKISFDAGRGSRRRSKLRVIAKSEEARRRCKIVNAKLTLRFRADSATWRPIAT